MIELGATYRDKITGYKGVATGITTYISGCSQVLLAAKAGTEPAWFDEQRIDRIGKAKIALDNGATPGFDSPAPIR